MGKRDSVSYIKWFRKFGTKDKPIVGSKPALLGEMYQCTCGQTPRDGIHSISFNLGAVVKTPLMIQEMERGKGGAGGQ